MKTIISRILTYITKFSSKQKKISLQEAIELKKQLYEQILSLEEKINNLAKEITVTTSSTDDLYQQLIIVLKLLDVKEKAYSELSNKIQITNVKSGNTENIKEREVLVRRRNLLKRLPVEISLPKNIFLLKPKAGLIKNVVSYLDKQIQEINTKLENINTKTFIFA